MAPQEHRRTPDPLRAALGRAGGRGAPAPRRRGEELPDDPGTRPDLLDLDALEERARELLGPAVPDHYAGGRG